jgi:hypothetical protein
MALTWRRAPAAAGSNEHQPRAGLTTKRTGPEMRGSLPVADQIYADDHVDIVAKTILAFNWSNYGLDEVDEIAPEYAEYAGDLAALIVRALAEHGAPS